MKTRSLAVLILSAALFIGCTAQTKLPAAMPTDASMSYASNGGMSPYYTDIRIEGESLSFKERVPGKAGVPFSEDYWSAKISPADKAGLYALFVENKFDRIDNERNKSITYDAGSEGVSLSFGPNSSYTVQSGANFPLSSKNKLRYQTIAAAIQTLAQKYETMREKPIQGTLEEVRKQAAEYFETLRRDYPRKTLYSMKLTPFFAIEWASDGQASWISYVYASGFDTSVVDGERASRPFAKITYQPAKRQAVLEKLSGELQDDDIQGVKPLGKTETEILQSGGEVEKIILRTENSAGLTDEESARVAAYYRQWRKYNGVIDHRIAEYHYEFNQWIDARASVQR